MKDYIKLVGLSVMFLIVSCNGEVQKDKTQSTETKEVAVLPENLEEVNFEINGMTCALGCAKMIENKLANAKGVDSAKVDFETKLAYISFDKTQQSKEELQKRIEALLDGNTYKASEIIKE
ncbi:MAG: heavy-metal-associated domain-containing protein [Flavobacteriaceae bacterium]